MKLSIPLALAAACLTTSFAEETPGVSPEIALQRLKDGNKHFVEDHLEHPHQTSQQRKALSTSQHPFAVIVGCADSRTSPEVVFDEGLGDLFVIRVAGNVANNETIGSIEYAVEHLGTRLIVVMGHERCGAINAARETIAAKATAPGHIQSLVDDIRPAVEATSGQDADATAKANEGNVAKALRESGPILKEAVEAGKIQIVAAHYDLDTGVVEFEPVAEKPAK